MIIILFYFFKLVNRHGQKVKYQEKDLTCITRIIHVKYKALALTVSKLLAMVYFQTDLQNDRKTE